MKIKILLVLVLSLVLSGCSTTVQEKKAQDLANKENGSEVAVLKKNINIGNVSMKDGKVDIEFKLKNTGSEPVVVVEGQTSCICTDAVLITNSSESEETKISSRDIVMPHGGARATSIYQIIEPGDEAIVVATFDPNAHGPNGTGPIKRDVYLETNSTKTPRIALSFFGEVIK